MLKWNHLKIFCSYSWSTMWHFHMTRRGPRNRRILGKCPYLKFENLIHSGFLFYKDEDHSYVVRLHIIFFCFDLYFSVVFFRWLTSFILWWDQGPYTHACIHYKKELRLRLWKWWYLMPLMKRAISEWNHMRGIMKVTFGQCIKTIIKTKHK